ILLEFFAKTGYFQDLPYISLEIVYTIGQKRNWVSMDIDSELDAGEREQNSSVRLVFFFQLLFGLRSM
ncbi:MAG TPA: hypothetical protein DCG23_01260, partial [Deltaproteobacteria bacterium]|nr:hypothetical protein [Deltaproteobacteria bacterium]